MEEKEQATEETEETMEEIEEAEEAMEEIVQMPKKRYNRYIRSGGRDNIVEEGRETMEEVAQRPKNRWLITTCRYCGQMYRFRSEEPQPLTYGKAQCIMKLAESGAGKPMASKV